MPTLMRRRFPFQNTIAALGTVAMLLGGHPAISSDALAQESQCKQPQPVCDAKEAVFAISSFDPIGSAVRIGETRLVTSRHVVADETTARLFLPSGQPMEAVVVPTDYPADLILIEVAGLPPGPILTPTTIDPDAALHTVGADVGLRRIRAYDPGELRFEPYKGKSRARLHHEAYSQPGNSGGALVDENGLFVGIVASGGEGRFEAIPATEIEELIKRSGDSEENDSKEIGAAVRVCTTLVENNRGPGTRLEDQMVKAIETSCRRSKNRQLMDLGGQTLAQAGQAKAAIKLYKEALDEDPNAINTRLGLAITYHLAREFEEALPHLTWLMEHEDDDLQVLRLSIQAGTWAGDAALANRALDRLREVNPQTVQAAEGFLNNPPPRPPKPE